MSESIAELQYRIRELERENAVLLSDDEHRRTAWLQRKILSQRHELDRVNRGNMRTRWQLRQIEKLGRGLTRDEYLTARMEEQNHQVAVRIGDPDA